MIWTFIITPKRHSDDLNIHFHIQKITADLLCHSWQSNLLALTEIIMISEVCSTRALKNFHLFNFHFHTLKRRFQGWRLSWQLFKWPGSTQPPRPHVLFQSPQFSSVHPSSAQFTIVCKSIICRWGGETVFERSKVLFHSISFLVPSPFTTTARRFWYQQSEN